MTFTGGGSLARHLVTDGNAGLENAVDIIYPFVKRQRCWAHKLRNGANYLKKKHLKECIKEARAIYSAKNKKEAEQAYSKWEERNGVPQLLKQSDE